MPAADRLSRHSLHEKEDLFSHLPLNVAEDGIDLYDGLSRYFDDSIEFEGKKARMEVSLVELPPLLQIQLQVGLLAFIMRVSSTERFDSECNSIVTRFSLTNLRLT